MPDVENVNKEDLVDVGEKEGAEIDLGKKLTPSIKTPSAKAPERSMQTPLINSSGKLLESLSNELIGSFDMLIGLPKICDILAWPSNDDNFSEITSWNPSMILAVSIKAVTPIESPPIASQLA